MKPMAAMAPMATEEDDEDLKFDVDEEEDVDDEPTLLPLEEVLADPSKLKSPLDYQLEKDNRPARLGTCKSTFVTTLANLKRINTEAEVQWRHNFLYLKVTPPAQAPPTKRRKSKVMAALSKSGAPGPLVAGAAVLAGSAGAAAAAAPNKSMMDMHVYLGRSFFDRESYQVIEQLTSKWPIGEVSGIFKTLKTLQATDRFHILSTAHELEIFGETPQGLATSFPVDIVPVANAIVTPQSQKQIRPPGRIVPFKLDAKAFVRACSMLTKQGIELVELELVTHPKPIFYLRDPSRERGMKHPIAIMDDQKLPGLKPAKICVRADHLHQATVTRSSEEEATVFIQTGADSLWIEYILEADAEHSPDFATRTLIRFTAVSPPVSASAPALPAQRPKVPAQTVRKP